MENSDIMSCGTNDYTGTLRLNYKHSVTLQLVVGGR